MNGKLFKLLSIIGVPVLFALLLHVVFGGDFWQGLFPVMSIAFLAGLPYGVGALTVGLSSLRQREKPLLPGICPLGAHCRIFRAYPPAVHGRLGVLADDASRVSAAGYAGRAHGRSL
jgi:hypothetical protein